MFLIKVSVLLFCLFSWSFAAPPAAAAKVEEDPNGPVYLKDANFATTIQNGTWWVDFFSPYCPHCTKLAPDWALAWKMIREEQDVETIHNFHMAKVDCVEQGDLCDKMDIAAYPALQLFRNGKLVTSYKKTERAATDLVRFAKDNFVDKAVVSGSASASASATSSQGSISSTSTSTSTVTHEFPQYPGPEETVHTKFPGSTASPSSAPAAPAGAPNPDGLSVQLDHTLFSRKITATTDPWFVKFYSPRCPHCNSMKPAWDEMARALKGKIHVGEINCDVQRQLCKDAKIDALPSLFYFSGSTRTPYNSLRGFADLLDFAKGASEANNLPSVDSFEQLGDAVSDANNDKATFVYFYDSTTVDEDFEAIRRVAVNTLEIAKIYKSNSTELAKKMGVSDFPSLYAVSDPANSRWIQHVAPTPKHIRDYEQISNWIKEIWLSFVPQLTPVNAQEIFNHAEYVVLGLIDPRDGKAKDRAINELKVSAQKYLDDVEKENLEELMDLRAKKQLKIDEAADRGDEKGEENAKNIRVNVTPKPIVGFAWIDSVFWNRYLHSKYGVDKVDKPIVIINDKSRSRYWDVNLSNQPIEASRSAIIETLEAVVGSPQKIQPKVVITGFSSFVWYIRLTLSQHWLASITIVVAVFIYFAKRRQNGHSELSLPVHRQPTASASGKLD